MSLRILLYAISKLLKFRIGHLFMLLVTGFVEIGDIFAEGFGFFAFFREIGLGFVHF